MVIGIRTGVGGVVIGGGGGGNSSGGITGVGATMSWIGGAASVVGGDARTLPGTDVSPEEAAFSNRVSKSTTCRSMTVEVSSRAARWSFEDGGATEVVGGEAIQAQAWGNIMANRTKPQVPRQLAAVKVWSVLSKSGSGSVL